VIRDSPLPKEAGVVVDDPLDGLGGRLVEAVIARSPVKGFELALTQDMHTLPVAQQLLGDILARVPSCI